VVRTSTRKYSTRKYLLLIVAGNIAAVIVGVAAAATCDLRIAAASASNLCTHYSYQYGTADPASQPQICYALDEVWWASWTESTNSVAIRDSNIFDVSPGTISWQLYYTDMDGSNVCTGPAPDYVPIPGCPANGNSTYGSQGSSNGFYKRAWCYVGDDPSDRSADFACTTLWTS
jgi:hypothetical protein